MKTALRRIVFPVIALLIFSGEKVHANGCTGSWFTMVYSPWCNCWQVCGNYISDCDEVVSLSWNFGDGTTGTGENPCHQFPGPGTYTVTMTVVAYCHNSFFNIFTTTCHITQTIVVPPTTPPLVADFTADTSCHGDISHFTNNSTSPGGNNAYTWVFPDGSVSHAVNPDYTFDSCGAFDIMLIVENSAPCCNYVGNDTIVKRVFVDCNPFDQTNQTGETEPYIHESLATVSVTSGSCAGDTTHFLIVPVGPIVHWVWTFPDSSISFYPDPWYVYHSCPPAINYTTCTIFTDRGCLARIDSLTGIFCPQNIGLSSTQTLCTNQCSGTATATLSGGTPPYTLQWNDPNNQTGQTATSLCPGPYTVTITDGNGCTATPNQPVQVTDFPFPLASNVTITGNIRCAGWPGGSALLTYTGGTPPYSSMWSNGVSTDTTSGLTGGNYYVTVTDAHGCTLVTTVTIPEPPPVQAPVTTVNATCNLCDGSATVNATGGNGVYNYTWQTVPVQTSQTANNLCAGVYTLFVEDANVTGCFDTTVFSIIENGAQAITATSTNALCYNTCNGTATVNFTGGCQIAPCNVNWLDSSGAPIGQTNPTATNLCAGSYIVNVTNGSGCTSFANVSVNVPNPVTASAISTFNTCGGSCNGTITVTATGGALGYTYAWLDSNSNVIAGQTGSTITGRCTGDYTVQVTDAQGCIAYDPITVYGIPFNATATTSPARCNGDCNGRITIIATGGATPYTYSAINSTGTTVYSGSSLIIANLCAGNYTAVATDANNCAVNIPVNVAEPTPLNPNTASTPTSCFGACNGTVSVTPSGGTPPYTYEWRNGVGSMIGTGSSVSNLCAGGYAVQITDSHQCVSPFIPVIIAEPLVLNDSTRVIDPYCDGGQGSIDLTPYGGTAPYSYNWNNGAYSTEDLSGLSSGTFTVLITDLNNCTKRDTVTFTLLPPLTISIAAHSYHGYNFKCYGGNDGEVVLTANGGLQPYTYLWDDSLQSTVDSIYGLSPGLYHVTVTDANGCVKQDSVNLNLVPPPFSLSEAHSDVLCYGDSSGSITITPVGGVPPYLAYWNSDTTLMGLQLNNIDTGQYAVLVFDSVFCLLTDTIQIVQPVPMTVSHTVVNCTCASANDGSIDLSPGGGISPYTFVWTPGSLVTEDISSLAAATYYVVVSDSNNCTIADSATITQPQSLSATVSVVNNTCYQGSDGSVDLSVTGAHQPTTYNWNSGQYATEDLQNIPAGTYTVLVTDSSNCTISDTATVTEPAFITGSRQVSICISDSFFVGGGYQNAAGTYYDTLSAANGCDSLLATDLALITQFNNNFQQTVCYGQWYLFNGHYYSSGGVYIDTLTTAAGCDSIITFTLTVLPDLDISASPDHGKVLIGDSMTVNILSNAAAGIITYSWFPTAGLSCANCPTSIVAPDVDTRYVIIGVDTNGCRDTTVATVLVSPPALFIPNVFTPNGDGANDFFEIFGNLESLRFLEIKVYDRWGEKVFESNDHHFKWDGTFKGKPMQPAVFVYTVNAIFSNEKTARLWKGSVTLMR
jgi:gliding motility-associated-like protein